MDVWVWFTWLLNVMSPWPSQLHWGERFINTAAAPLQHLWALGISLIKVWLWCYLCKHSVMLPWPSQLDWGESFIQAAAASLTLSSCQWNHYVFSLFCMHISISSLHKKMMRCFPLSPMLISGHIDYCTVFTMYCSLTCWIMFCSSPHHRAWAVHWVLVIMAGRTYNSFPIVI